MNPYAQQCNNIQIPCLLHNGKQSSHPSYRDITMFDGWDTSKLQDWLSDIETTADILKESHAHLGKAKSQVLTHNHVCKALKAWKSWDDIWDILHLKICNANIHTYTSQFMEIWQKENETLATYLPCFKMEAKRCDFNYDTTTICIFVKGLREAHNVAEKVYEKDPQTLSEVIKLVEKLHSTTGHSSSTPPTVNMMSKDHCFVCGKKGHTGHHCPQVQCYNCDDFGHFAWDFPKKIPSSGMPHHHNKSHSHSHHNHSCRDRSHSFHHTQPDESPWQVRIMPLTSMWQKLVTIRDTHPASYPTTTTIFSTLPQTGTLEGMLTGIPYTTTGTACPDTHHARATQNTTPLTTVSLSPGTPWALPTDCIHGRHQSHIHRDPL